MENGVKVLGEVVGGNGNCEGGVKGEVDVMMLEKLWEGGWELYLGDGKYNLCGGGEGNSYEVKVLGEGQVEWGELMVLGVFNGNVGKGMVK